MTTTKGTKSRKKRVYLPEVSPLPEAAIRAVRGHTEKVFLRDKVHRMPAHQAVAARVVPKLVMELDRQELLAMPTVIGDVQIIMGGNGQCYRKPVQGFGLAELIKEKIPCDEGMLYPVGDIYPMGLGHRVDVLCVRG